MITHKAYRAVCQYPNVGYPNANEYDEPTTFRQAEAKATYWRRLRLKETDRGKIWVERFVDGEWKPLRGRRTNSPQLAYWPVVCVDCGIIVVRRAPSQIRCPGCQILKDKFRHDTRARHLIRCCDCGLYTITKMAKQKRCTSCGLIDRQKGGKPVSAEWKHAYYLERKSDPVVHARMKSRRNAQYLIKSENPEWRARMNETTKRRRIERILFEPGFIERERTQRREAAMRSHILQALKKDPSRIEKAVYRKLMEEQS